MNPIHTPGPWYLNNSIFASMNAIKTPNGFLHSIGDSGEIEETKSIYCAELIESDGMACATVRFILSQFPHHKRFSIYSFKVPPAVLPAPLRS